MPKTFEQHIEHSGLRLWVEQFGSDGPVCLLVGGAGAVSSFWPDPWCECMARAGYRVVRFDHRDAGRSSFVDFEKNPYGLTDLVADSMRVLDTIPATEAHIVGHSMGGFIAQLAAAQQPDRVLSMTSMSSHTASPDVPPPPPETWDVMLANVPTGELDADLPGFMGVWRYLNGEVDFDEAAAEAYTRDMYARNPRTLPANNHVAIQADMDDREPLLRELDVPALVIHGELDPLVPVEGGRMTARALRNGRLLTLPGAGHMFFNHGVWDRIGAALLELWNGAST